MASSQYASNDLSLSPPLPELCDLNITQPKIEINKEKLNWTNSTPMSANDSNSFTLEIESSKLLQRRRKTFKNKEGTNKL